MQQDLNEAWQIIYQDPEDFKNVMANSVFFDAGYY